MKTLVVWDAVHNQQVGPTYSLPDTAQFYGVTTKPAALDQPRMVEMPQGIMAVTITAVAGRQTLHIDRGDGAELAIKLPVDVEDWRLSWDYIPAQPGRALIFEDQFAQLDTTRWLPADWDPNEPTTADHNPRVLAHHVFADGTLMISSRVEPGVEVGGIPLRTTGEVKSVKVTQHEPVDGVPINETVEAGRYPLAGRYEIRAQLGHSDWAEPQLVLTNGATTVPINPAWMYCPADWAVYAVTLVSTGDGVHAFGEVNGTMFREWEVPIDAVTVNPDEFWRIELRTDTEAPGGEPYDMLIDWVRVWA